MSDERLVEVFKEIRAYRRNRAIEEFLDRSHFFWMFDPRPDEVRDFLRLHCPASKHSLVRVRRWVSWHRLSSYAKKGWKGLLIPGALLPIASLLNLSGVSGDKLKIDSPVHLLVLGSALLLVAANLLFQFGCRRVVKWATNKEERLFSADPTRDLITDASEILLNEATGVPITPREFHWLENGERESAMAQISAGYPCFRAGFTPAGRYLVEKLVVAAAEASKASAFVRSDTKGKWHRMEDAGFIFPAKPISVWTGFIERKSQYCDVSEGKEGDFLLQWSEADSRVIPEHSVNSILHDVEYLVTKETHGAVLEELARWTSYSRPARRLLTAGLYILSSALLVVWMIVAAYALVAPAV